MDTDYTSEIKSLFLPHVSEKDAKYMSAYLKNKFICYGIKTPVRRELLKQYFNSRGYPPRDSMQTVVEDLWNMPERDFQYVAIHILEKYQKNLEKDEIKLVEKLITSKSWWDTVDGLAGWIAGSYFRKYPEQILPVTRKWMQSGNMWLQRSSLLFQLKYKESTNNELLSAYILELRGSKEFFIQKAIGWTLREYSKTNPLWVEDFVNNNQLPSLSRREALKHINRIK